MLRACLLASAVLTASCSRPAPSPSSSPPAADASATATAPGGPSDALAQQLDQAQAGVDDPRLAELLRDHWDYMLRSRPRFATDLGVRDYDDRLRIETEDEAKRRLEIQQAFFGRVVELTKQDLSPRDRDTALLLGASVWGAIVSHDCRFSWWNVNAHSNPLDEFGELGRDIPLRSVDDARRLLERFRAVPDAVDQRIALLRKGLAEGLVGNAESLRRVIVMFDAQLATPAKTWPLLAVVDRFPPEWSASDRTALTAAYVDVVTDGIVPAMERYRDVVADELLPAGRTEDDVGLSALPKGAACYSGQVRRHTTLGMSYSDIHDIGLQEIERLDAEIAALGKKALGTKTLAATLEKLRTDPALFFASAKEVEDAALTSLSLAKAKMPAFFGRLPQADCVVARVPDYKAPFTTIAYYEPAHTDGTKPGEYFVNVLDPKTRPRYEARVLAVHESIPGHHLQIAIGQELDELPAFRRHEGYTAFVEGWALYTERLAEEMGMYETDLDRLGMLSFDAWRASRLVVDTGLHGMGWSRAKAIAFLTEHTALASNNIDNEVDRYIAWPGQALGYKLGQLEIWELRRMAERELGERFDLKAFHDVVLGGGAVILPLLRQHVEAWVTAQKA